jgi:hypothetical protein
MTNPSQAAADFNVYVVVDVFPATNAAIAGRE